MLMGSTPMLASMENMLTQEETERRVRDVFQQAFEVMQRKNHDYKGSWQLMRATSITDQIRTKIERVYQLETLALEGKESKVAEGIESELVDIINYAAFELIKLQAK